MKSVIGMRSRVWLLATFCLLGGCGSTSEPPAAENASVTGTTSAITTPATPVALPVVATSNATYDASVGVGVDANGFADLPLRSGAHRYFVNSATGSDNNSCAAAQSPSTPKGSGDAALACATDGEGDQILFAERTSYPTAIPSMHHRAGGNSLAYPFVFQSYDPDDPLNESKYGRASGNNRPVFSGRNPSGQPWIFGGTGQKFIAVRGIDINPGNLSSQNIGMVDVGDGILFENNLLRYTGIAFVNTSGTKRHHWIVRGNSVFGTWDDSVPTGAQGIYADGSDSLTVEDNVLYHIGWRIGANRTDAMANGGATGFRHPIYQQIPTDAVVRRNLIVDGATDGGTFRGNILHYENLVIDCPIGAGLGGGTSYNTGRPDGVTIESHHNAIIGTATIAETGANGWGLVSLNGRPGSSAHHNLVLESGTLGASAFITNADYDQPSYMDWHDNVSYQWSPSGYSHRELSQYSSQLHATFSNNVWDDPTSGSNTNVQGRSFATPYTAAQLYAALGFGSKEAFMEYAMMHPEVRPARTARQLLFNGFGLN